MGFSTTTKDLRLGIVFDNVRNVIFPNFKYFHFQRSIFWCRYVQQQGYTMNSALCFYDYQEHSTLNLICAAYLKD